MMFDRKPALVRIQFGGRWTRPGSNPRWAYQYTHWITCFKHHFHDYIFDCNGGIRHNNNWRYNILPHLLPKCGDSTWWPTHIWQLPPPPNQNQEHAA